MVKGKMGLFGHTTRNSCPLTREIIQGNMESSRESGRSKTTYMNSINGWTGGSTAESFHMALNRGSWERKKLAGTASSNCPNSRVFSHDSKQ
ncbi:endonuclease-reverse transcriptase [Elysia marginata]|uniref:Endonuclease-reverse transcriptase n=1 Tax=Elysia marginata TaxID=1093978 RepID=A0AAV4IZX1_9GAST|nr:endonuclease-reverse transcriptase [Elysia marginata]